MYVCVDTHNLGDYKGVRSVGAQIADSSELPDLAFGPSVSMYGFLSTEPSSAYLCLRFNLCECVWGLY